MSQEVGDVEVDVVEEVVAGVVVGRKMGATGFNWKAVRPWRWEEVGETANVRSLVSAVAIVAGGVGEVRR
jgi:Na+/H+ antiporter NhaA